MKKKKKRKSQRELLGIRDHCVKLQKEGASAEEMEAWLFMADLTDNERLDIKGHLKSCRNDSINKVDYGNVTSDEIRDLGKASRKSFNGFDSASSLNTAWTETTQLKDEYGSPTSNVNDKNCDDTDSTIPVKSSSDSLPRKTPAVDTQKREGVDFMNVASESVQDTKASTVPKEDTSSENPMPQRRPRVSRSSSESGNADGRGNSHDARTHLVVSSGDEEEFEVESTRDVNEQCNSTPSTKSQIDSGTGSSSGTDQTDEGDVAVVEEIVLLSEALSVDNEEGGTDRTGRFDTSMSDTNPPKATGVEVKEIQPSEMADITEKKVDPVGDSEETDPPKSVDLKKENKMLTPVDIKGETAEPSEHVDVTDKTESSNPGHFQELGVETSNNLEGAESTVKVSSIAAVQKEKESVDRLIRLVSYSSSEADDDAEKPLKSDTVTPSAVTITLAERSTPDSDSTDVSSPDHSRSPSFEKPAAFSISAENSESPCPLSPRRRKVRRKKHRAPVLPFFDDSIKVQLNSDSWKSFGPERQIPDRDTKAGGTVWEAQASQINAAATADCTTFSTQTEGRDFGLASKSISTSLCGETEDGYRFLAANSDYACAANNDAAVLSLKMRGHKLKLDKSTTVDITVEPSADWLYSCFPEVAMAHLNEVLEVCHGDVTVAVELMFEWGISNPITPRDQHQLRKEMAKYSSQASPWTPEAATCGSRDEGVSAPQRLVDLCMSLVPQTNTAIQQQVINSSEQRLQRIESTESQRIRTLSYEESCARADSSRVDLPNRFSLSSFTSGASPRYIYNSRYEPMAEVLSSHSSSKQSSQRGSVVDFQSVLAEEIKVVQQKEDARPKSMSHSNSASTLPRASASESALLDYAVEGGHGDLALPLPLDLVGSLEQLFGKLPIPNRGESVGLYFRKKKSLVVH